MHSDFSDPYCGDVAVSRSPGWSECIYYVFAGGRKLQLLGLHNARESLDEQRFPMAGGHCDIEIGSRKIDLVKEKRVACILSLTLLKAWT